MSGRGNRRSKCAARIRRPSTGGESILILHHPAVRHSRVFGRVSVFLFDVAEEVGNDPAGPVVLVTHNGVIRMVRHLLDRVPLDDTFARSVPHLEPICVRADWEALARFRTRDDSAST